MCMVSNVGDYYNKDFWEKRYPWTQTIPTGISTVDFEAEPVATKEDISQLRKEIEAVKDLLKKAIELDKLTGEPDCQKEGKLKAFKEMARLAGIDLKDLNL